MGPYYIFSYLAPVDLSVTALAEHGKVAIWTTMGIVLGFARIIRILLFDEVIDILQSHALVGQLLCIVLIVLICLILWKRIRQDIYMFRQQQRGLKSTKSGSSGFYTEEKHDFNIASSILRSDLFHSK